MTVRFGNITFSGWASLEYEGGFTDTFIFHIDALNGLPPFGYRPLLQRLTARLNNKRRGASLWIQVDSLGEWYLMEVKRSLSRGFKIPHAVTAAGQIPEWTAFSRRPDLWHSKCTKAPAMKPKPDLVSMDELKCMRTLARIQEGLASEIASLADLDEVTVTNAIASLRKKKLLLPASEQEDAKIKALYWQLSRSGLSYTMRRWNAPPKIDFTNRREGDSGDIRTPHRHVSRMWPSWLRSAYPKAEIWMGWSEVRIPGISVRPDALAWGRIQGFETLFWLEVGDNHKGSEEIEVDTRTRLEQALVFCRRTGVHLVYAQVSPNWVKNAATWGLSYIPNNAAVVMGRWEKRGGLPIIEWGRITTDK
jgi:hypothetical protein